MRSQAGSNGVLESKVRHTPAFQGRGSLRWGCSFTVEEGPSERHTKNSTHPGEVQGGAQEQDLEGVHHGEV